MEKLLPCGHSTKDKCYKSPNEIDCQKEIGHLHLVECDHYIAIKCYQKSIQELKLKCPNPCQMQLECGHFCNGSCGECRNGKIISNKIISNEKNLFRSSTCALSRAMH